MANEITMAWKRPAGPPKVWNVVDAVRRGEKEEQVKLKIQEIPEDRHRDVIEHMKTYFLRSEVLCCTLNVKDDEEAVKEMCHFWLEVLKQGVSVAAIVDDPTTDRPEIVGLNVLCVVHKADEKKLKNVTFKSHATKTIMSAVGRLSEEYNVMEKHDVDRYLVAYGLSVKPSFRGQRLAEKILNARVNIGQEYDIPLTSTVFTSDTSQKVAGRAGYDVYLERDYDQIKNDDGNLAFPGIKVKSIKIMGRKLT